jgi:hypothetical protein
MTNESTGIGTPAAAPAVVQQYSFANLWASVGRYWKNDAAPTGDALTDCKRIVNEGYLDFLQAFDWSFLTPSTTITVGTTGTEDLPADFALLVEKFTYPANSGYGAIRMTTPADIRNRWATSNATGIATLAAIEPAAYVSTTGQRWSLLLYPKPQAAVILGYRYRRHPAPMTADEDIPWGSPLMGPTIQEAVLARAEIEVNKVLGPHRELYLKEYLPMAIERDKDTRPRDLGQCLDPRFIGGGPYGMKAGQKNIESATWTHTG